ncbi:MAG: acetoin utilization protein AcuC [Gammaproteobacteria bacterium]|nr:acetoin utilization protein AcuC [Gammaproteobacteria bacterium]
MRKRSANTCIFTGPAIAAYGFGNDHPFGLDRHDAFIHALEASGLAEHVTSHPTAIATREQLALFHTDDYIARVKQLSDSGTGFLDSGDTPAMPGIYESAAAVAGTSLAATEALMSGECRRAFVPIAGLHHARRDRAGGFCVFNDCGIVIEHLVKLHGLERIAYVDIDAHHGDGVFYAFEDSPRVYFADLHEDGRCLYPGTGAEHETGKGAGAGRKLNIAMAPGADDRDFLAAWLRAEQFIAAAEPQFIILQCGADSLAGDPITHLAYSEKSHAHAASRLAAVARTCGHSRVLALGGGGYNRDNLARAWCAVVRAFIYSD